MRIWIFLAGTAIVAGLLGSMMFQGYEKGVTLRNNGSVQKKLSIMTYSTFASQFGPANELIARFKAKCNCEVEVNNAGDSVLMLKKLAAKNNPTDLVLGLDPLTINEAKKIMKWKPLTERPQLLPELKELEDEDFVPFDWSPMTFVYRAGEIEPPHSIQDLLDERFKNTLALQDPRLSTPGLQLALWLHHSLDSEYSQFLKQLKNSVATLAPTWALSYSTFKRGQAKLVYTYQTSVVYHWNEEKNRSYQTAVFENAHAYQAEFASIPENCRNCDLAQDFIHLLTSPEGQHTLMTKNYMFPVINSVIAGSEFQNLPQLRLLPWSEMQKDISNSTALAEELVQALK